MELIDNLVKKIETKQKFSQDEIDKIISLYSKNEISDEQILPLIKSIYYYGITDTELYYLTNSMLCSGEKLDLECLGQVVDKHSTGGVSDTTTIIIAPICACLGTKMLKLSGKALGFTGGTADKLECFEGYKTTLPIDEAINLVQKNGACMITTSSSLAPADKKIYNLRDKTGLVDNIPLIASSIMSKKLACNCDIIVLDVKYGNGAFMQNKKDAKLLGKKMKAIGELAGKKIKIRLGKMNQPLGYNIGAKLEAMEAIEILSGKKKNSLLYKDSVCLASLCVSLDKNISYHKAKLKVEEVIRNGRALEKLKTMVLDQGGNLKLFNEYYTDPTYTVISPKRGKVRQYNTKEMGSIVAKMCEQLPPNEKNKCGIRTFYKLGEKVNTSSTLFQIYANDEKTAKQVAEQLLQCVEIK